MTDLTYLDGGLIADGTLRPQVVAAVSVVASGWRGVVDATEVDILAELLARIAEQLGEEQLSHTDMLAATAFLELPGVVVELLEAAVAKPLTTDALAALALHLVDIAEVLALAIYVPELPALSTRSDRSADAARRVGTARHLRG